MSSVSVDLAIQVGGLIVSAAILVLGVKLAINGLRGDLSEVKADMKILLAADAVQNERIVAVEKESEAKSGWIRRIEDGLKDLRKLVERRSEN